MKRDEVSRLRTLQHSLERKIKTAQEKVDRLKTELSVVKRMIVLAKNRQIGLVDSRRPLTYTGRT